MRQEVKQTVKAYGPLHPCFMDIGRTADGHTHHDNSSERDKAK